MRYVDCCRLETADGVAILMVTTGKHVGVPELVFAPILYEMVAPRLVVWSPRVPPSRISRPWRRQRAVLETLVQMTVNTLERSAMISELIAYFRSLFLPRSALSPALVRSDEVERASIFEARRREKLRR